MFSYSRTAHNTDLFGVPLDNFFADVALVPWAEKTIPKVYWRGSGTGALPLPSFARPPSSVSSIRELTPTDS
jgi:hypothetical protein